MGWRAIRESPLRGAGDGLGCGRDREVSGGHWPPLQTVSPIPCRGGLWPPETYDHHRRRMNGIWLFFSWGTGLPSQDPLGNVEACTAPRPPLTRGLDFAKQKTGGENNLQFSLLPSALRAATSLIRGRLGCGANPGEESWGGDIEGPSGRPVPTRKTGCGAFDPGSGGCHYPAGDS